jgi:lycopene cyclase domain-containing protein
MGLIYLAALAVSLTGMITLDRRFRLFFWRGPVRAAVVLVVGVAFFLVWDVFGITLGIFFRGETSFMTGVLVGPELPLEEVFFLCLLCYFAMNLFAGVGLAAAAAADRRRAAGASDASSDSGASGADAPAGQEGAQ